MLLNQYQVNFMHLCRALSEIQTKLEGNQKSHSVEDVERNLEERNEEYRVFKNMKEHVQHFIDICRSMRDIGKSIGGRIQSSTTLFPLSPRPCSTKFHICLQLLILRISKKKQIVTCQMKGCQTFVSASRQMMIMHQKE